MILTRNLPGKLCNGTTGKVVSAEKDKPPVINFNGRIREFHNKVPPDKMPLLCRKFCVINKPFTENIVYFCL